MTISEHAANGVNQIRDNLESCDMGGPAGKSTLAIGRTPASNPLAVHTHDWMGAALSILRHSTSDHLVTSRSLRTKFASPRTGHQFERSGND